MKSKLREDVRQRLDAAEADKVAAEERAKVAEEELLLLEEHIEVIKEKIGRARKACLLPDQSQLQSAALKIEAGAMAAAAAALPVGGNKKKKRKTAEAAARVAASTGKALYEMLGKTGEAYSQDIIELGLTLMAAQLTAPQAVAVMRAFVRAEYPEKKEGADYRIPNSSRFREWRRYLEPICHYIGVSVLKLAVRSHLLNDATTKKSRPCLSILLSLRTQRRGRRGGYCACAFEVRDMP